MSCCLGLYLSGCAGAPGKAARYYLIDPVAFDSLPSANNESLIIEIVDLHIPQYLERFHIATRALAKEDWHFQIIISGEKTCVKTCYVPSARNLSKLLSTHDIGTPLNRSASRPDFRLQVYIEQFEQDIDNNVNLIARWQLTKTGQQQPIGIFATELQGNQIIRNGNYEEMVAVMRQLYGQLSEEIANTILAPQN